MSIQIFDPEVDDIVPYFWREPEESVLPTVEELVTKMHETFAPLGVNVSLPSLRINHQLRSLPELMKAFESALKTAL